MKDKIKKNLTEEDILQKFKDKKWQVEKNDRGYIFLTKYHRKIIVDTHECKYWCKAPRDDEDDNYISFSENILLGKLLSFHDFFNRVILDER